MCRQVRPTPGAKSGGGVKLEASGAHCQLALSREKRRPGKESVVKVVMGSGRKVPAIGARSRGGGYGEGRGWEANVVRRMECTTRRKPKERRRVPYASQPSPSQAAAATKANSKGTTVKAGRRRRGVVGRVEADVVEVCSALRATTAREDGMARMVGGGKMAFSRGAAQQITLTHAQ